jgi:hypothetical protein
MWEVLACEFIWEKGIAVFKELTDRIVGPVARQIEISGRDGGPIRSRQIIATLSDEQAEELPHLRLTYITESGLAVRPDRPLSRHRDDNRPGQEMTEAWGPIARAKRAGDGVPGKAPGDEFQAGVGHTPVEKSSRGGRAA